MSDRTTLLLADRQAFRDAIKRLEIQYDWAIDASKEELHSAIVAVGLEDPERLRRKLREIQSDVNVPECTSCGGANHLSNSPHCRDCILEQFRECVRELYEDIPPAHEIVPDDDEQLKLLIRDERVDSDVFDTPADENKSGVQDDEDGSNQQGDSDE
ncbi:hypothetical protein [Natronorubrum sp. DTA28]|uniref:hypothetical protein n=1 Tax=Natronorubrum sp. DTA28 TaxID=3447019 RepID=UPI003F83FA95